MAGVRASAKRVAKKKADEVTAQHEKAASAVAAAAEGVQSQREGKGPRLHPRVVQEQAEAVPRASLMPARPMPLLQQRLLSCARPLLEAIAAATATLQA